MRLPPSLLTESERQEFRAWFRAVVQRSGKSKKELARAMGDDSTERLNRWLGGRIPSKAALRKLARVVGMPYVVAALRAGYFDELVEPIGILLYAASEMHDRRLAAAAMLGAFACFPQPGAQLKRDGFFRGMATLGIILDSITELEERGAMKVPRRLPGVFGAIVRILREPNLDARDRRDAAALMLRSLAFRLDGEMARAVEADLFAPTGGAYQQALREVLQRLSTAPAEIPQEKTSAWQSTGEAPEGARNAAAIPSRSISRPASTASVAADTSAVGSKRKKKPKKQNG
jgi:transcriptional regulator with XRE-family HTH domain